MADLERQLAEDKALRDAAKQLMTNGLAHLRSGYEEKGLGARFIDRMKEGADGVVEDASDYAREYPGQSGSILSLGLGALLAYIFRDELAAMIDRIWTPTGNAGPLPETPDIRQEPEPETLSARSDSN